MVLDYEVHLALLLRTHPQTPRTNTRQTKTRGNIFKLSNVDPYRAILNEDEAGIGSGLPDQAI
jgi:hypothetical protein